MARQPSDRVQGPEPPQPDRRVVLVDGKFQGGALDDWVGPSLLEYAARVTGLPLVARLQQLGQLAAFDGAKLLQLPKCTRGIACGDDDGVGGADAASNQELELTMKRRTR